MSKIKIFANEIGIPYLVHFTRLSNLESILTSGLLPVSRFGELSSAPTVNDELRLDGHLEAISTSIAFPNYRMFYKLRQDNPAVHWVVLLLDKAILWKLRCGFCSHNAADSRISGKPLEELCGHDSLRSMYAGDDRSRVLKPYDPSDAQAEVLVLEKISPELIEGIVFNSHVDANTYREAVGSRKVDVHVGGRGLFSSRDYYRQ